MELRNIEHNVTQQAELVGESSRSLRRLEDHILRLERRLVMAGVLVRMPEIDDQDLYPACLPLLMDKHDKLSSQKQQDEDGIDGQKQTNGRSWKTDTHRHISQLNQDRALFIPTSINPEEIHVNLTHGLTRESPTLHAPIPVSTVRLAMAEGQQEVAAEVGASSAEARNNLSSADHRVGKRTGVDIDGEGVVTTSMDVVETSHLPTLEQVSDDEVHRLVGAVVDVEYDDGHTESILDPAVLATEKGSCSGNGTVGRNRLAGAWT